MWACRSHLEAVSSVERWRAAATAGMGGFRKRVFRGRTFEVRPPPYLINFEGINPFGDSFLHLFYVTDPSVEIVQVRDIYRLEIELFQSLSWVLYYCFSVFVFLAHYCLGWQKVILDRIEV